MANPGESPHVLAADRCIKCKHLATYLMRIFCSVPLIALAFAFACPCLQAQANSSPCPRPEPGSTVSRA